MSIKISSFDAGAVPARDTYQIHHYISVAQLVEQEDFQAKILT